MIVDFLMGKTARHTYIWKTVADLFLLEENGSPSIWKYSKAVVFFLNILRSNFANFKGFLGYTFLWGEN